MILVKHEEANAGTYKLRNLMCKSMLIVKTKYIFLSLAPRCLQITKRATHCCVASLNLFVTFCDVAGND